MSVATAPAIRRPEDLEIPVEARKVFNDLFPHLTDKGKRDLVNDVMDAYVRSQKEKNLRPLQETIEAWYRTLIIHNDKNLHRSIRKARRTRPKSGLTVPELKARFGV